MVLGDPQGVVKQGNIRVGTSASALSRLLTLAISLLLLATMRTELSQLSAVLPALLSACDAQLLRTSLTWLKGVIALIIALPRDTFEVPAYHVYACTREDAH